MLDENGETRRDRNERFNYPSPPADIPDEALHLIEWFDELSDGVPRKIDGVCHPIPWTEFLAWASVTGRIVRHSEYAILRAMDRAYCVAMNEEYEAYRARQADAAQQRNK